MNRRYLLMGACALAGATALPALAQDDISKKLINEPGAWNIYGAAQTNKQVKDANVQGGQAMEIKIAGTGGNPWDAAAESQITGKISKGDKIVVAVWTRSKTADNLPANLNMRLQVSSPPYASFGEKAISVGPDWQMQTLEFTATEDHASKTSALTIHLNTGKQTIYLGPAFILNMGQA
ncbi:MAG: hypothetical protein QM647_06455 [Asticcacaulis sp.]|uniref:hypothetical protein n=1 Tax=Asticcacaulis sp. TaxID=1872648 RepID=UPI0039E238DC